MLAGNAARSPVASNLLVIIPLVIIPLIKSGR